MEIGPSAVPTSSTLYGSPSASNRLRASVGGNLLAPPLATFLELAPDLFLDPRQILLADRLREFEVVVEPVVDRRADGDLHAGVKAPYRLREQVCRGVAEDRERIGIVLVTCREDLDRLAVLEGQPQVLHPPVRTDEDGLVRELRPDRTCGIEPRRAGGKFEFGAVG